MNNEKTNQLVIQTPEGITFSLLLAGPVTRFLAWIVDVLCFVGLTSLLGTILAILGVLSADVAGALGFLIYFVVSIGYGILFEWAWRGQTIGKKLFKIRVVDIQGLKLRFSQVMIRNLMRGIDAIPAFYMVGGIACLLSPKGQRLGDLAANTVVIRHPEAREPDLEQLLAGKYNSFRKHPHLCARLRQHISPAQAGVLLQGLLRRESLIPQERVKLYGEIADQLKSVVKFPEEAVEGLSDEQYLRNAADVLYNTGRPKA
jgi:uncharacterized RDD family membrane protein YckC